MALGKVDVRGLNGLKRAFTRLPGVTKAHLGAATQATAVSMVARARATVRVRFGILRDHLGHSFSTQTGTARVGIRKGRIIVGDKTVSPGKYGHLQEFGTPAAPAAPFMIPAAEAEREPYLTRCRAAGQAIEKDMKV